MNEYRYFQDNKVTSWIRTYFTINAESIGNNVDNQ